MKTLKYFLSFYKPYLKVFTIDLLCASLISIVDVLFPLILNTFTQEFLLNSAAVVLKWLPWITLGLLLMYLLKTACRYYVVCQGHIMGAQMEADMRRDLFNKLTTLSYGYYDQNNTGTMSARIISDLNDISEFAHHGPENLFISLIKIIGSFAIMASLCWQLSLCLFIVTLIMLVFSWMQNKKMDAAFMTNRRTVAQVNARVTDSLEGIRVVQAFGNERVEQKKFGKSNKQFLDSKSETYRVMGTYYAGNYFFQGLLYTTVLCVGGLLVVYGQMEAYELATFALYVNVFVAPLEILIEFTEMFQRGFSGFRRFEEIMDEVPEIKDKPDAKPLVNKGGQISFEHVTFAYDDEQPVLEDVSFTIPAGGNYSLAGPSGSGKTTICSLIPRFYDPKEGSVKVDGQDVRDLSLDSLRSTIGVVSQDVYLFDGTIEENVRYGKWDASREDIMDAIEKADLKDLVDSLPEGIETKVGERGTRLSGGQKQRIAIARLFLKDPDILILDEATSALDNESEYYIQKALKELAKGRTCLTIAHRLSTIENSDQILVIDQGKVAEKGTHQELLKQNGIYASYVKRSFN
ncbi:ABC transporter ATP-binding protein [Erysipelotrichaceae bacterium RD49]|nr:ABC transporter ATP-binding protein [Erysipelotrichaceae bacterium RD49]